jgi:predicted GNAT family N-acyltransferase
VKPNKRKERDVFSVTPFGLRSKTPFIYNVSRTGSRLVSDRLNIRFMSDGEEYGVCALVARVFGEYVAGDFSTEGVEEVSKYAEPNAMAERIRKGNKVLLAEEDGQVLGMLELKRPDHIAMLFVDDRGRGLGRALVERALQLCREGTAGLETVTVHASLYAVPIYRKLGFEAEGPERTENGITYVPMVIRFETDG